MSERRLTPRQQYDVAYCQLRHYGGMFMDDMQGIVSGEICELAILSYDDREMAFSGWVNAARLWVWWDAMIERHPERVFPF